MRTPVTVSSFVKAAPPKLQPLKIDPVGQGCPCGGTMLVRTRRADGVKFLGCSRYPQCRRTAGYRSSHYVAGRRRPMTRIVSQSNQLNQATSTTGINWTPTVRSTTLRSIGGVSRARRPHVVVERHRVDDSAIGCGLAPATPHDFCAVTASRRHVLARQPDKLGNRRTGVAALSVDDGEAGSARAAGTSHRRTCASTAEDPGPNRARGRSRVAVERSAPGRHGGSGGGRDRDRPCPTGPVRHLRWESGK